MKYELRVLVILAAFLTACAAAGLIGFTFGAGLPITITTVFQVLIVAGDAFIISVNLIGIRDRV